MSNNNKYIAIYTRVSSDKKSIRSQVPDLQRWEKSLDTNIKVRWFSDSSTGRNMQRPGWEKLWNGVECGLVKQITVWRLDRMSRSVSDASQTFEKLKNMGVKLVSLTEGFDLTTPMGKAMATMLATFAQLENEVRAERIRAGQSAAKDRGVKWGGSKPGIRGISQEQLNQVAKLKADGLGPTAIARATGIHRSSVYRLCHHLDNGVLKV